MSNHSAIAKDSESSSRVVILSHGNVSGGSVQLLSSFVLAQFFLPEYSFQISNLLSPSETWTVMLASSNRFCRGLILPY